jgi:hypothetical protein
LFAWTGLKAQVTEFVKQCDTCQHAKHSNSPPGGLLQPLPLPVDLGGTLQWILWKDCHCLMATTQFS